MRSVSLPGLSGVDFGLFNYSFFCVAADQPLRRVCSEPPAPLLPTNFAIARPNPAGPSRYRARGGARSPSRLERGEAELTQDNNP